MPPSTKAVAADHRCVICGDSTQPLMMRKNGYKCAMCVGMRHLPYKEYHDHAPPPGRLYGRIQLLRYGEQEKVCPRAVELPTAVPGALPFSPPVHHSQVIAE